MPVTGTANTRVVLVVAGQANITMLSHKIDALAKVEHTEVVFLAFKGQPENLSDQAGRL